MLSPICYHRPSNLQAALALMRQVQFTSLLYLIRCWRHPGCLEEGCGTVRVIAYVQTVLRLMPRMHSCNCGTTCTDGSQRYSVALSTFHSCYNQMRVLPCSPLQFENESWSWPSARKRACRSHVAAHATFSPHNHGHAHAGGSALRPDHAFSQPTLSTTIAAEQSLVARAANDALACVCFTVIIDDIVFPDGRTLMGALGGGGAQLRVQHVVILKALSHASLPKCQICTSLLTSHAVPHQERSHSSAISSTMSSAHVLGLQQALALTFRQPARSVPVRTVSLANAQAVSQRMACDGWVCPTCGTKVPANLRRNG